MWANTSKNLGTLKNLKEVIINNNIEEVIIAIESTEQEAISDIINKLNETYVTIKQSRVYMIFLPEELK